MIFCHHDMKRISWQANYTADVQSNFNFSALFSSMWYHIPSEIRSKNI